LLLKAQYGQRRQGRHARQNRIGQTKPPGVMRVLA
jgi:hypothetical protein